jgi:hypothetical protein
MHSSARAKEIGNYNLCASFQRKAALPLLRSDEDPFFRDTHAHTIHRCRQHFQTVTLDNTILRNTLHSTVRQNMQSSTCPWRREGTSLRSRCVQSAHTLQIRTLLEAAFVGFLAVCFLAPFFWEGAFFLLRPRGFGGDSSSVFEWLLSLSARPSGWQRRSAQTGRCLLR